MGRRGNVDKLGQEYTAFAPTRQHRAEVAEPRAQRITVRGTLPAIAGWSVAENAID